MAQCVEIKSVKDLLSTGLLEGVPVTYNLNKQKATLKGFIKADGYVCACSSCDYSGQVLSALQFEKHAGATSHNQNNHILLDNGVSLYEVFHKLRDVPANSLDHELQKVTGVSVNLPRRSTLTQGQYHYWNQQSSLAAASQASSELARLRIVEMPSEEPHMYHFDLRSRSSESMPNFSPTESETMEEVKNAAGEQLRNSGLSSTPVKGLKTPTKLNPESVLKDVRGLLTTGLLEGFGVSYKKNGVETNGLIHEQGYLCGCSACKYSNVLNACEFEKHSGESSSNQNDHIFLDCGITLYELVQTLKGTSLHLLGDVIQEKIGLPPNLIKYETWKASFQVGNDDPDAIPSAPSSILSTCSSQESVVEEMIDPALGTTGPTNSLEKSASECSMNLDWSTFAKRRSHRKFKRGTADSTPITSSTSSGEAIADAALGTFRKNSSEKTPGCSAPASAGSIPVTVIQDPSSNHSVQKCTKMKDMSEPKLRDTSLHQLIFKEDGLPDGTVLTYRSKGEVLITGHKRGTCIVCACHKEEFSPSQFEAHAGMGRKRQPYRSIYTPDGMTLHQLSVELHRGLKLSGSRHDEHPKPTHSRSGTQSSTAVTSTIVPLKRILQERVVSVESCHLCGKGDTILDKLTYRTIFFCNQCERACHVSCYNKENNSEKSLEDVVREYKQFNFLCCQKCRLLRDSLKQMLQNGGEKVFLAGETGSTKGREAAACWQLFSARESKNRLIPPVIEIFLDAFGETTAGDKDIISDMVEAKLKRGEKNFRGMYCAVITVKSVVVSAALLKVRIEEVAELVLVATRREWRRKGYCRTLVRQIEAQLKALKVRLLTAPVDPAMQSIWTEKLGFTISSEEQKMSLLVAHPIVMFKNLSLAQKSLTGE